MVCWTKWTGWNSPPNNLPKTTKGELGKKTQKLAKKNGEKLTEKRQKNWPKNTGKNWRKSAENPQKKAENWWKKAENWRKKAENLPQKIRGKMSSKWEEREVNKTYLNDTMGFHEANLKQCHYNICHYTGQVEQLCWAIWASYGIGMKSDLGRSKLRRSKLRVEINVLANLVTN